MSFYQETVLKNIRPDDVVRCFHSYDFIKFLTLGQPVKIQSWSGIDNNKTATFLFWFFGWRQMSVVHENYSLGQDYLSFVDKGLIVPFGLKGWRHQHIVKSHKMGALIIDKIFIDEENTFKKYLIYPIMLFPIIIRRLTYKVWFYFLEGKKWTSIKRSNQNEN